MNMPRRKDNLHQIQILFTQDEYEDLKRYAALERKSMSTVIREFSSKGIRGELTEENIDFLTPIIRKQLKSIMDSQYNRLATLIAKTCIQAGTAAYLSAEALKSFVPANQQRNFVEAYEAARKKSLQYMKSGIDTLEKEESNNESTR